MDDKWPPRGLDTSKASLLIHSFVLEKSNINMNATLAELLNTLAGRSRVDIFTSNHDTCNPGIHAASPTWNALASIASNRVTTGLERHIKRSAHSITNAARKCHMLRMRCSRAIMPASSKYNIAFNNDRTNGRVWVWTAFQSETQRQAHPLAVHPVSRQVDPAPCAPAAGSEGLLRLSDLRGAPVGERPNNSPEHPIQPHTPDSAQASLRQAKY